jgi:hypothetical protein
MRLLIIVFLNLIIVGLFAQRNPNTNAGKINPNYKSDTSINNQTNSAVSSPNQAVPPIAIDDNNSIQLGASLNYGTTLNQSDIMENGFGFGIKLGFNLIKDAPIALYTGLGFDYLYFGGKKISQANNVDVAINSNAYGWYPYADLELGPNWPITIFGTAFWGGRFFYTRQNITFYDAQNNKQTNTKNLEGDATQIYGYGGGIKWNLSKGIKMELRYLKNYGNYSKVVDPKTIEFDSFGNLKSYQNKYTDTDLGVYSIGLILNF